VQYRTWPAFLTACLLVVGEARASGQTEKPIVLQHADSLLGLVINGEEARELVGNVVLSQENVLITCDQAVEFRRQGRWDLAGNVVIRDDTLTLRAPRGSYHRSERRAEAFEDVRLDDRATTLTAVYGEYFVEERRAFFHTNVIVRDSGSVVLSDSLTYFRETRRSISLGHVRAVSSADRVTIYGGRLDHDPVTNYDRMTIDPLLVQIDSTGGGKADTLQVRGRILEAFREGMKRLVAHDSVTMVRSDLAARGQEACLYTEGDSLQLRTKPYLWYEESQVSGDSMNVYLKHRKLERLLVMGNTLTMSESDSLHPGRYDQMMGDLLTMQFDTSGLHRTDVEGRAISVYHLYDDSLANGLNRTSGDRIVILFAGGKAASITVYGGVEGDYFPENMVNKREKEYALPSFRWRTDKPEAVRVLPVHIPPLRKK